MVRQWGDFQSHGSLNEKQNELFGDRWVDSQIPTSGKSPNNWGLIMLNPQVKFYFSLRLCKLEE